jgi:hypothetical protein
MTTNQIKIVKYQNFFREWLARKNNIYGLINKFKICSTKIDNSKPKINYSQIFQLFGNSI